MLTRLAVAALALASVFSPVAAYTKLPIGDRIVRDFGVYTPMPITADAAKAQGWIPIADSCSPNLGYAYAQSAGGATKQKPLILYFTPAGQVSGAGVLYRGPGFPQSLIDAGYLQSIDSSNTNFFVSVTFRGADQVCSNKVSKLPLGDRLVINANSIAEELPLTAKEAQANGWVRGSCFATMGNHWFRDLTSNGTLTWSVSNLLPIVTMYDEFSGDGSINAFFFASPLVQQSILPPNPNQWEPIALPNPLMCKNFCDSNCGFKDLNFAYSTLHLYLKDQTKVTCFNGCKMACCKDNVERHQPRQVISLA